MEKFLINNCGLYGAIAYCESFGSRIIFINESKVAKQFTMNKKEFLGM